MNVIGIIRLVIGFSGLKNGSAHSMVRGFAFVSRLLGPDGFMNGRPHAQEAEGARCNGRHCSQAATNHPERDKPRNTRNTRKADWEEPGFPRIPRIPRSVLPAFVCGFVALRSLCALRLANCAFQAEPKASQREKKRS